MFSCFQSSGSNFLFYIVHVYGSLLLENGVSLLFVMLYLLVQINLLPLVNSL